MQVMTVTYNIIGRIPTSSLTLLFSREKINNFLSSRVGGDPSTPNPSESKGPGTPAPQTPSSQHGDAPPKYPGGPQTPHTPTSDGLYHGDGPATPHTPSSQDKARFPAPSPSPADPRFPIPASPGRLHGGMSPSHMGGMGPEISGNLPLNPATPSSQSTNTNMSSKGFDPISSMAQMSQQLAGPGGAGSTPCSTPNSVGPGPDSGLGSMGNLEPGMINSPLGGAMLGPDGNPVFSSSGLTPVHDSSPTGLDSMAGMGMRPNGPPMQGGPGPRGPMMGPGGPMGGNMMGGPMGPGGGMPPSSAGSGTFATVKASAPNTIQYLPSRPPNSQAGPRGPPSLEFLQRFANPGMDKNMGPMGMGPGGPIGPNGPMMSNGPGGPMTSMNGPMPMGMNGPMMGPGGPMGPNGPRGMMGPGESNIFIIHLTNRLRLPKIREFLSVCPSSIH